MSQPLWPHQNPPGSNSSDLNIQSSRSKRRRPALGAATTCSGPTAGPPHLPGPPGRVENGRHRGLGALRQVERGMPPARRHEDLLRWKKNISQRHARSGRFVATVPKSVLFVGRLQCGNGGRCTKETRYKEHQITSGGQDAFCREDCLDMP